MDKDLEIAIGDGHLSKTKELRFYPTTLIGSDQKIVLIDTPGLDDSGNGKQDEENLAKMFEELREVENIRAVLLLLKHKSSVSGKVIECVKNYHEFLNVDDDQKSQ